MDPSSATRPAMQTRTFVLLQCLLLPHHSLAKDYVWHHNEGVFGGTGTSIIDTTTTTQIKTKGWCCRSIFNYQKACLQTVDGTRGSLEKAGWGWGISLKGIPGTRLMIIWCKSSRHNCSHSTMTMSGAQLSTATPRTTLSPGPSPGLCWRWRSFCSLLETRRSGSLSTRSNLSELTVLRIMKRKKFLSEPVQEIVTLTKVSSCNHFLHKNKE